MKPVRNERGAALIMTLIVALAVLGLGAVAMTVSRSDSMVSSNTETGTKALWAGSAGSENAKNWLSTSVGGLHNFQLFTTGNNNWFYPPPALLGNPTAPVAFADGSFVTRVRGYGVPNASGNYSKFEIDTVAGGPDNARVRVTEIVKIAGIEFDFASINIDGASSRTEIEPTSSHPPPIPTVTIDGRDFDRYGKLQAPGVACPDVSPIAGPVNSQAQASATQEAQDVREEICDAAWRNLNNNDPPGLHWTRNNAGFASEAACANATTGLDLHWGELRAASRTPSPITCANTGQCLAEPKRRGPYVYGRVDPANDLPPLFQGLDAAGMNQLRAAVDQILSFALKAPPTQRQCLNDDILSGTRTFGSWDNPKIVIVPKANSTNPIMAALSQTCTNPSANNFRVRSATVSGTGLLVIGRRMDLERDANFHWRGIILIMSDGDLRVEDASTCGAIYGAIVLQDGSGNDAKVDFAKARGSTCANPFWNGSDTATQSVNSVSVNHSCEAIRNALTATLQTMAWFENLE